MNRAMVSAQDRGYRPFAPLRVVLFLVVTSGVVAFMVYLSTAVPPHGYVCSPGCNPAPLPATLPISERDPGVAVLLYVLIGIIDAAVIAFVVIRGRRDRAARAADLPSAPPPAYATPPRPGSGPAAFPDMAPPLLAVAPPPPELTPPSSPGQPAVDGSRVACTFCGYSLDPRARFCGNCGRPSAG
jgi:hypothetical protein